MSDEPQTDLSRVGKMVRDKMTKGEFREDFAEGQDMLEAMNAVGRLPSVGARTIKGLGDEVFDGLSGVLAKDIDLDGLREQREAKLIERKKK